MEARRNHTAEVLFWTPTPVGTSPTSTVMSEDEDDEQAEKMKEDDFVSQMDENGIIGLPEGLEDVQLEETYGGLKVWSGDEMVKHGTEHLLEGDKSMEKKEEENNTHGKKRQLTRRLGDLRATSTLVEGYNSKRENDIRSTRSCGSHLPGVEPSGTSKHHCLEPQSASTVTASFWPPCFQFTAEELAAARGIDAESFPEMSLSERFPESYRSHSSCKSSPRSPEINPQRSPQRPASFSDQVISNRYNSLDNDPTEGSGKSDKHRKQPASSLGGADKQSPRASSSRSCSLTTVEMDSLKPKQQNNAPDKELRTLRAGNDDAKRDESRKGYPSYHTPDFSKVEPRVRFPRSVYEPPKSKRSLTRKSFSPEPPLVFKSPADIVKEVLLNNTDGSSTLPDCNRPATTSTTNSTVPLEFRCRQQATTLLEQLQEDYNRLLTKYAEAENTIDRLRLEAKVNLYSDPPRGGQLVHSGLNRNASGVLKLDFPQAQRTETSSTSPDGPNTQQGACPPTGSPDLQLGQQLANILFDQTDMFLQQLQTFEDLLKREKLKSFEKIKGLVQLTEGLNSLERGYLLARDEHKLLQQRGAETCHFDPERELEGLIFQCGVRMEELKEQVEQLQLEQPTCDVSSSPTLQPTSSFDSSEGGESLIQPQNPTVPLLVHPGESAKAAENGNEEEAHDEENLSSLYLTSQITSVPDLLNEPQSKSVPRSATLKSDMRCVAKDEEQEAQGVDDKARRTPSPRKVESRHWDPLFDTSKCQHTRASPPLCSQSTMLPVLLPHSRRKFESHSSSLSSLADITALQKKHSKGEMGSKTVLSQDGIISPETDSGFVGSETSHLIPAAAPSLLQQRASESVPVFQDGNPRTCETGTTAASPPSRLSFRHVVREHTVDSPTSQKHPRRRQEQSRCPLSCAPHRWMSQRELNSTDSGTSEFGLESDGTHTGSEVEHSDQYTQSVNSLHSSHSSSSPAALCRHGDSLTARRSSQVANYNDAMQVLQAEVAKLKTRLESCLRHEKPLSTVTAAPVHKNCCHSNASTPHIRSTKQRSDVNQVRRENQTADEVEANFPSRETTRERLASAQRQKPQHDILRRSEVEFSTPQPQSTMSRCTQTSATPDPTTVLSKGTQTRQHPASDTADVSESRHGGPHCLHRLSTPRGHAERPVGVSREPTRSSSCCHCCPAADGHKQEAVHSPGAAASSRYFAGAVPPAVLQCTPVCTPQLLLYPGLVHVSPNEITDASSRVRSSDERTGRTRRSLSAEKHRCLDSSLSRAIKAARHMKHTSRHMARSLATGLQDQELLTQSCSN